MSRFFITGTDTDAGKTVATCQLLRAFVVQGFRSIGMKPVASGCEWRQGELCNGDVARHATAGSVHAPLEWVSPYRFEPPISPHLAARQAGMPIDLDHLVECAAQLEQLSDVLLIEGAGGWLAPLSDEACMEDLAVRLNAPVILVVGMRLGCLNHAFLTARAIMQSGLPFAGWIANRIDPDMDCYAENLACLRKDISAPCLAEIAYSQDATNLALPAECIDAIRPFCAAGGKPD
ncbi:MAG: dethiobiotin synthase [Formivibrio sp.]|nr:dethiobiotin synthase [Formivibrio sp.]